MAKANPDYAILHPNERATVRLFGRTYHWERDEAGALSLQPGASPHDTPTED